MLSRLSSQLPRYLLCWGWSPEPSPKSKENTVSWVDFSNSLLVFFSLLFPFVFLLFDLLLFIARKLESAENADEWTKRTVLWLPKGVCYCEMTHFLSAYLFFHLDSGCSQNGLEQSNHSASTSQFCWYYRCVCVYVKLVSTSFYLLACFWVFETKFLYITLGLKLCTTTAWLRSIFLKINLF